MTSHNGNRQAAYRRGLAAETLAAWWLRLKGYRILAARYKTAGGEIDLVARRGNVIAFVEVKRRRDPEAGYASLTFDSSRRIADAAEVFISRHPRLADHILRFDLVLISPGRLPRHLPHAFEISDRA